MDARRCRVTSSPILQVDLAVDKGEFKQRDGNSARNVFLDPVDISEVDFTEQCVIIRTKMIQELPSKQERPLFCLKSEH